MRNEEHNRSQSRGNGQESGSNKGERGASPQQGAASVSKKGQERHEKDDSSRGADRNTTKKGANSI